MWTETIEGRDFVQEISRDIVSDVAPEELDMFDDLAIEYFHNPNPPDVPPVDKDDPLGFGLNEMLVAISPGAIAGVSAVTNYLITEVLKSSQAEGAELIKRKIENLFNPEKENTPPLTKDQLEQVRKLAIKQAIAFKISPDKAKRMADALIGSLSISKTK